MTKKKNPPSWRRGGPGYYQSEGLAYLVSAFTGAATAGAMTITGAALVT